MRFELIDFYQNALGRVEVNQEAFYLSNEKAAWTNSQKVSVPIQRPGKVHCCKLNYDQGRRHRMSYNGTVDVVVGMIIEFEPGSLNVPMKDWREGSKRGTMACGEAVKTGS